MEDGIHGSSRSCRISGGIQKEYLTSPDIVSLTQKAGFFDSACGSVLVHAVMQELWKWSVFSGLRELHLTSQIGQSNGMLMLSIASEVLLPKPNLGIETTYPDCKVCYLSTRTSFVLSMLYKLSRPCGMLDAVVGALDSHMVTLPRRLIPKLDKKHVTL